METAHLMAAVEDTLHHNMVAVLVTEAPVTLLLHLKAVMVGELDMATEQESIR